MGKRKGWSGDIRERESEQRGERTTGTGNDSWQKVHLISAITNPLFCQIDADLILSSTGDSAPAFPPDDSFTGNWRMVRNGGLHSISFVKKRGSHSRLRWKMNGGSTKRSDFLAFSFSFSPQVYRRPPSTEAPATFHARRRAPIHRPRQSPRSFYSRSVRNEARRRRNDRL